MVYITKLANELSPFEKQSIINIYIQEFSRAPREEVLIFENISSFIFEHNPLITYATNEDEIVGFMLSYESIYFKDHNYDNVNTYYIDSFAIKQDYHRFGLGQLIFEEHKEKLKKYNLITRCGVDMTPINSFLMKNNFIIIDTYLTKNEDNSMKNIYLLKQNGNEID